MSVLTVKVHLIKVYLHARKVLKWRHKRNSIEHHKRQKATYICATDTEKDKSERYSNSLFFWTHPFLPMRSTTHGSEIHGRIVRSLQHGETNFRFYFFLIWRAVCAGMLTKLFYIYHKITDLEELINYIMNKFVFSFKTFLLVTR